MLDKCCKGDTLVGLPTSVLRRALRAKHTEAPSQHHCEVARAGRDFQVQGQSRRGCELVLE